MKERVFKARFVVWTQKVAAIYPDYVTGSAADIVGGLTMTFAKPSADSPLCCGVFSVNGRDGRSVEILQEDVFDEPQRIEQLHEGLRPAFLSVQSGKIVAVGSIKGRSDLDLETIAQMEQLGGSFVKALANAARHADPRNLEKIKATFSDYWTQYQQHAIQARKATRS